MVSLSMNRGFTLLVLLILVPGAVLNAAEPTVRNLPTRGVQIGGPTTLVIEGDDLGTAPRLLLSFPAKQKLKPGNTDKLATFEVSAEETAPPGYHHLRVVTEGGISPATVIGVDRLPQRVLAATIDAIPAALHGTVSGAATVETRFTGKAGEKVIIEVEAQRLGSKLRPIVHLYSPKNLQVAWSWPSLALDGDTRLEATLPEEGSYRIAIHDTEYAGAAPGFFRLKVGQWSFVDHVFPPVIGKDTKSVELVGSTTLRLDLPAAREGSVLPLPWPKDGSWSGPRPFVTLSSRTEILEQPATGKPQELPAGAVGVCGRLLSSGEEDRYRVPIQPGSKVRLEVFADRLGSPVNVALVIRNEAGNDLARAVEKPGTLDPFIEYTVPDKVTAIVVCLLDAQDRGGPRGVYRLTIDPVENTAVKSDFHLFTPARRIILPLAGQCVIPVLAERQGYEGPITLSADGLPAGMKLEGTTIPPGANGTLVTISRGDGPAEPILTRWRGRSLDGQERPVVLKGDPLEKLQPWLATELAVAPTSAKGADFQIDWRGLPADAGLVPTGKLPLPVKLTKPATSPVRLTLLTSQVPPIVNNVPDVNQTLRAEKPVEIAVKVTDGDLTALIPTQLASLASCDVSIQAELLTPDRRAVVATAYTPVRRLPIRLPVIVQLDGPPSIEAKLDPKVGSTFEIKGKVERREGFAGPVALTLTGLPAGTRADPINLAAGVSAFSVKVVFPPTATPGEIRGLKLVGTVTPVPGQPAVQSRALDLVLVIRASK